MNNNESYDIVLANGRVIDVSGMIVVKDSKVLKDVFPGKPIRLPVQ
jgi:hypothetical protein